MLPVEILSLALMLSPADTGSHESYLEQIEAEQTLAYEDVVATYDVYVSLHPDDAVAALERCRFIDAYSDDATECSGELVSRFPENANVLRYRLETLSGDRAISFALATLNTPDASLTRADRAYFYQHVTEILVAEDKLEPAAVYAREALALDGHANVRRALAAELIVEDRLIEAITVLSHGYEHATPNEVLERAKLLEKSGAMDRARWLAAQAPIDMPQAPAPRKPKVRWFHLFGAFAAVMLLPGLWVIPAHYWSLWRRQRHGENETGSRWRFRHVWITHALFLLGQALALYWFAHEEAVAWLTSEESPRLSLDALATYGVVASVLSGALALSIVRRRDLPLFGSGIWHMRQSIGAAVVSVLALFFLMLAWSRFRQAADSTFEIQRLIRAMALVYGVATVYFVCALLAPVVEELVFRSVLLDAYARYMPFLVANILQAGLFAAAHMDITRVPQLFLLGFVAGQLRHRSGGLLASITLHALNNIVAISLTLFSGQGQVRTALVERKALVACLGSDTEEIEALRRPNLAPVVLNNVAWRLASTAETSEVCLLAAERAVDEAARDANNPAYLDTKATVYWRLRRMGEAVDLARAVAERDASPFAYSQLARFIGKDPAIFGEPKPVHFVNGVDHVTIALPEPFENGATIYARVSDGGVIQATLPPGHAESYTFPLVLPEGARIDLALLDARGCEGCKVWKWNYEAHDPTVDSLP